MTGILDQVQLHLVDSLAALDECRRWAGQRRPEPLGVDTESAGLNVARDRCRLIQLGDCRAGWAFPADGWGGAAAEIIRDYPGELVMFNSPYDWRVLARWAGMTPRWERTHDGQLSCHIADSMRPQALKARAALDIDPRAMAGEQALHDGMSKQGWTWATVPANWAGYWAYGALDPVLTAHMHQCHLPAVTAHRAAYDLERAYARICADMMTAGMMIDVPFVERTIAKINAYVEGSMAWLKANYGVTSVESNDQVGRALNQAGIPTAAWTGTGKPSISKDTLRLYVSMYPEHADLLQMITWCRKGSSITGRYLGKFLELRDTDDVIHYSIHSTGARATGRSSVTDPPMQTYDRDEPVIRGAYIPRPGCVFITIDADQIEARLAAHFSRDPRMIADFHECDRLGLKFFIVMASKIYGCQISKTDPRYTMTKNATYGQLYGAGLEKAAATAGVPVEQMRPAYEGLQQLYPRTGDLMRRLIREARAMRRPGVQTLTGRWLWCHPGREYALTDYKCQGSAAEIMKQGAVSLAAAGLGEYLRLTIHDEFLLECPAGIAPDVLRTAEQVLTDRENFAVPLTWSGTILEREWRKT